MKATIPTIPRTNLNDQGVSYMKVMKNVIAIPITKLIAPHINPITILTLLFSSIEHHLSPNPGLKYKFIDGKGRILIIVIYDLI